MIASTNPDIVVAMETWLKEGVHHDDSAMNTKYR